MARKQIVSFTMRDEQDARLVPAVRRWSEQVRQIEGVEGVSYATVRMMRGSGMKTSVGRAGEMVPASEFMNTSTMAVGPGYFETMGQKWIAGREPQGKQQVVVNETFARKFGNGGSVVGKQFGFGTKVAVKGEVEVVGVVSDAKYRSMREPMQPVVYGAIEG